MKTKKEISEQKKNTLRTIVNAYNSKDLDQRNWAIQEMLKEVQGFIGHMIDKHFSSYKKDYYDDLYNEGVIAVLEEMGHFDPDKGTVTTFFTPYILHRLNAFINIEVNRSTPYYTNIMKLIKNAQKYFDKIQVTPSVSDIALYTGLSVKKVEDGLRRIAATNEKHYQSIEELDLLENPAFKDPEEELLEKEQHMLLMQAIAKLELLDREIIALRFGLDEDSEKSYAEISKILALPVNKVMNSVNRSIRIMSNDQGLKNLRNKHRLSLSNTEMAYIPDKNMSHAYDCLDDDLDGLIDVKIEISMKNKSEKKEDDYFVLTV